MATVKARQNENFNSLLRRFKNKCDDDKIVQETRERQQFEKPCVKRKIAKKKAIKRTKLKIEKETQTKTKKY